MSEIIVKVETQDYSYIGFTFDGKHSIEDFGIYRVSDDNEGYDEALTLEKNDQISSHYGIEGEYFLGTNYKGRSFNVKIAFDNLTESKLQGVRKWLSTTEEKELWFSENPYKVYFARISSPPQITTTAFLNDEGKRIYKGTGSITFTCSSPFGVTPDYIQKGSTKLDGKTFTSYQDFPVYNEIKAQLPGHYTTPELNIVYSEMAYGLYPSYFIASLANFDYKITYNSNNASKATIEQNVPSENPTVTIAQNTFTGESGYYFVGWNTKSDGTGENYSAGNNITIAQSITLYARWSRNNMIIYHANNGTDEELTQDAGQNEFNLDLQANTFTKTDNYFIGWNTDEEGKGIAYPDQKKNVYVLGVMHLYAQWSEGFGVTYYSNNSNSKSYRQLLGVDSESGTFIGSIRAISDVNITPDAGHYFIRWNTQADGNGTDYKVGDAIQDMNITLYAIWDNLYTVTIKQTENKSFFLASSQISSYCQNRALKINGAYQNLSGDSSGWSGSFQVRYGQEIELQLKATNNWYCDVYTNGNSTYAGEKIYAKFRCPGNVQIDLTFKSRTTFPDSFEDVWNGTYKRTCWDANIKGDGISTVECGSL